MKRIVVKLSGMPFDPTYEIDDDTIAVGDLARVPGSDASFIEDGEIGTVIALAETPLDTARSFRDEDLIRPDLALYQFGLP